MDSDSYAPTKTLTTRYKCSACYKQYKKKERLVEHMKVSFHSAYQPRCAVCHKYCQSVESLREHLNSPLAKANCSRVFSDRGCELCLRVFDSPISLCKHRDMCCLLRERYHLAQDLEFMFQDQAMKVMLLAKALKLLLLTLKWYSIQTGIRDPYEDCVSVMGLYKRMRAQDHQVEGSEKQSACDGFDFWKPQELEKMTP